MRKAICLTVLAIALTACQKNRENDPVLNAKEAGKDRDLQEKTFESGCAIKPIDAIVSGLMTEGKASLKSQVVSYRFEGANVIRNTRLYTSVDCTGDASLIFEEAGKIDIATEAKTNDGARFIDMEFKTLVAKVGSDKDAQAANEAKLCGVTDWSAGNERDVQNHAKDILCYNAEVPRKVANVYRVDNNVLYLGTLSKGTVLPEDRPTSLDKFSEFKAK